MNFWRNREKRISGFLDHETNLTGELQFVDTLRIDGNFQGSITGDDTLIVGENAVIHADIQVNEIEIRGQVCGNVEARTRAEIHSSGRLIGDLNTAELVIHPGGILDGHIRMIEESPGNGLFRESTRIVSKESERRTRDWKDGSR